MQTHKIILLLLATAFFSCTASRKLRLPDRQKNAITGTEFYKKIFSMSWKEREEIAKKEILNGNIPGFLKKWVRINTSIVTDDGQKINAHYFVLPDYVSIGSDEDFARIPLTPMAAQIIADSLHCFLPTTKMVDEIYRAAAIKLDPVPMYAFRDSAVTMYQHHLIIEGQRKLRKGLIAGIKKDVVTTNKLLKDATPNRVAIYGWHKLNGVPIQPLYTGHVNWYVDYSHGIRLVFQTIYINNKPMNYWEVLGNKKLRKILTNEEL